MGSLPWHDDEMMSMNQVGQCFPHYYMVDCPWRYKHLGQFAPLGGEQTAAQLPGDWVSIGHSSQWLWYSVYAR